MTTSAKTCSADAAAAFVDQFRAVWATPTLERIDALAHPDICLIQPLLPDVHGRLEADEYWRRVFTLIPDLHLAVISWAVSTDSVVYIEFQMKGTLGRHSFSVLAVDRYDLDSTGRVRRRILYCDPLRIAREALRLNAIAALLRGLTRLGASSPRRA